MINRLDITDEYSVKCDFILNTITFIDAALNISLRKLWKCNVWFYLFGQGVPNETKGTINLNRQKRENDKIKFWKSVPSYVLVRQYQWRNKIIFIPSNKWGNLKTVLFYRQQIDYTPLHTHPNSSRSNLFPVCTICKHCARIITNLLSIICVIYFTPIEKPLALNCHYSQVLAYTREHIRRNSDRTDAKPGHLESSFDSFSMFYVTWYEMKEILKNTNILF